MSVCFQSEEHRQPRAYLGAPAWASSSAETSPSWNPQVYVLYRQWTPGPPLAEASPGIRLRVHLCKQRNLRFPRFIEECPECCSIGSGPCNSWEPQWPGPAGQQATSVSPNEADHYISRSLAWIQFMVNQYWSKFITRSCQHNQNHYQSWNPCSSILYLSTCICVQICTSPY